MKTVDDDTSVVLEIVFYLLNVFISTAIFAMILTNVPTIRNTTNVFLGICIISSILPLLAFNQIMLKLGCYYLFPCFAYCQEGKNFVRYLILFIRNRKNIRFREIDCERIMAVSYVFDLCNNDNLIFILHRNLESCDVINVEEEKTYQIWGNDFDKIIFVKLLFSIFARKYYNIKNEDENELENTFKKVNNIYNNY